MADKCRNRKQKLGGFEKWHFHLVIERLPITLWLAVLSLECALSRYLWTLTTTIYYSCPSRHLPSSPGLSSNTYHIVTPRFPHRYDFSPHPFLPSKPQENPQVPSLQSSPCDEGVRLYSLITAGTEHTSLVIMMVAPDRGFENIAVDS